MVSEERPNIMAAAVYAALLFAASLASASETSVRLFGVSLPPLCSLKLLTGWDCPGCGITRSIILALHGDFHRSFLMHIWGIPLLIFMFIQIPYQLLKPVVKRDVPSLIPPAVQPWITPAVLLSLFVPWTAKSVVPGVLSFLR